MLNFAKSVIQSFPELQKCSLSTPPTLTDLTTLTMLARHLLRAPAPAALHLSRSFQGSLTRQWQRNLSTSSVLTRSQLWSSPSAGKTFCRAKSTNSTTPGNTKIEAETAKKIAETAEVETNFGAATADRAEEAARTVGRSTSSTTPGNTRIEAEAAKRIAETAEGETNFGAATADRAEEAARAVETGARDVAGDMKSAKDTVGRELEGAAKNAAESAKSAGRTLERETKAVAEDAAESVEGAAKTLQRETAGDAEAVQATAQSAARETEAAAKDAADSVEGAAKTLQREATADAESAKHAAKTAARETESAAKNAARETESAAAEAAETAKTAAQATKDAAVDTARSAADKAETAAKVATYGTTSAGSKIIAWIYGTGVVLLLSFGFLYVTDTRASIHQYVVVPFLRYVHSDPEEAHHAGIRYIKALYDFGLAPRERGDTDKKLGDLQIEVFGHVLDNPIGTSAGIDKNAEVPDALFSLGPAVVEVGGVTPLPQEGNPKPRVFRIPSQNALINRYGLNSEGAEHVAMQLRERVRMFAYHNGLGLGKEAEDMVLNGEAQVPPGSLVPGKMLLVQMAKNKVTPDGDIEAIARDYTFCVEHLAKYADVLVVNVSSPNTPGLRDLQAVGPLTRILGAVVDSANACERKTKPKVMVKVSPDEDSEEQIEGICAAVWASGVDGVIVGNTTKKRPDTIPKGYELPEEEVRLLTEVGGYSGPQMFERTLSLVGRYRSKLDQGPQDDVEESTPAKKQEKQQPTQSKPKSATPTPPQQSSQTSKLDDIDASIQRDAKRMKPDTPEAEQASKQPLIQIPDRHTSTSTAEKAAAGPDSSSAAIPTSGTTPSTPPKLTAGEEGSTRDVAESALKMVTHTGGTPDQRSEESSASGSSAPAGKKTKATKKEDLQPKVIFATGGITNGEQCLQILNAGASVCQVYTAMMYGGVGTVTRMKGEMRREMRAQGERKN
ncbi:hypothetical protein TI39_contig305g00034 [Zymoseptoria brevis]|uniref:Dihydroorotate dehydrogenase (quinone), mitochondrial n=1 Tax=Zymoseptoria brevis TaxID=1047168 RepID=A0A0F4GXU8_9PEZI|nr:hypothetical protein TI39_contig305g00034 [Zymoseptoria brevis]